METLVELREVSQQYLAAVRERTTGQKLAATIRKLLDENAVYTFFKQAGIERHSHNVFVYWDEPDNVLVLEVAAQVFEPFEGNGRVFCSSTPEGRVATALHRGPWDQIGRTHRAIIDWCRANGHAMTGLRWEVYGRHNDDPSKLETEVFYQIK